MHNEFATGEQEIGAFEPATIRPELAARALGPLHDALFANAAGEDRRNVQFARRPKLTAEQECAEKVFVCEGHANEIVPGLYLGSEHAAALPMSGQLRELGVRAVVNCTPDVHNTFEAEAMEPRLSYVRIAVRDEDQAKILPYFAGAADFIDVQMKAGGGGGGVLVHCQYGVSRSASVVIAFLIRHRGMTRDEAYTLARSRRRQVSPNLGFWMQLAEFESRCRASTASTFDEDWSRESLAAFSLGAPAFADVEPRGVEGLEAVAGRSKQALIAGLGFALSRACGACNPSDVAWLRALCVACDGGASTCGGGLALLRELIFGDGSKVLENWESDFSREKFEALLAELAIRA